MVPPGPSPLQGCDYFVELHRNWSVKFIVLSFVLATVGSNATLHVLGQLKRLSDPSKRTAATGCAAWSLSAGGIFAMHFVGMSALEYSTPGGATHSMRYTYGFTILSICLPFMFSWAAFYLLAFAREDQQDLQAEEAEQALREGTGDLETLRGTEQRLASAYDPWHNWAEFKRAQHCRIIVGSVLISASVTSMHYLGMTAQELDVRTEFRYNWLIIVLSALYCEVAAWLALVFAFVLPITRHLKLVTALVMGLAVCVMHYLGMFGIDVVVRGCDIDHPYDTRSGFPAQGMRMVVGQVAVMWNLGVSVFSFAPFVTDRERDEAAMHSYIQCTAVYLYAVVSIFR
eukprot:TRINITY_DN12174_c0_g1_i1.p1 TRINITY_DN12174_c0_g1~~TRINITY_DN12174_c0_g1_i1.p1  ORF type:complete len:343 (+),score=41.36 TRINITY_DN12174_c0_g1_i1:194-1222(+)